MNIVLSGSVKEIAVPFLWRDKSGENHDPADMSARHLFMTLVMIWNHTMPEDARVRRSGRFRHHIYRLGPHYSAEYLKDAIRSLGGEITQRELPEDWWRSLRTMRAYLVKHRLLENFGWD